jgi:hypothetical protein
VRPQRAYVWPERQGFPRGARRCAAFDSGLTTAGAATTAAGGCHPCEVENRRKPSSHAATENPPK